MSDAPSMTAASRAHEPTFLSDDWFAAARRSRSTWRPSDHGPASVAGCNTTSRAGAVAQSVMPASSQVVEGGALPRWEPGELDRPDIEIRWDWEHAAPDLAPGARRHRCARGHRRRDAVPTATTSGPPSPVDLGEQPELDDLPQICRTPRSRVQYEYPAGPSGTCPSPSCSSTVGWMRCSSAGCRSQT